jgi:hypothetical protein
MPNLARFRQQWILAGWKLHREQPPNFLPDYRHRKHSGAKTANYRGISVSLQRGDDGSGNERSPRGYFQPQTPSAAVSGRQYLKRSRQLVSPAA